MNWEAFQALAVVLAGLGSIPLSIWLIRYIERKR